MSSAASTLIGSEDSRLIIIRGNSGSGKSRLAKAIRAARPRGIAIGTDARSGVSWGQVSWVMALSTLAWRRETGAGTREAGLRPS